MKNITDYINESLEGEFLTEGFLQKLKDGISNFIDNPKKYLMRVQDKIKDYKKWYKDHKEYIDTIEKLNNDEDLKKMYRFIRKHHDEFEENWSGCGYDINNKDKKGYKNSHNIIKKYLYPNATFEQCWAVFDLMGAIDRAIYDAGGYSSKSSSSNSSKHDDDSAMWAGICAAI